MGRFLRRPQYSKRQITLDRAGLKIVVFLVPAAEQFHFFDDNGMMTVAVFFRAEFYAPADGYLRAFLNVLCHDFGKFAERGTVKEIRLVAIIGTPDSKIDAGILRVARYGQFAVTTTVADEMYFIHSALPPVIFSLHSAEHTPKPYFALLPS